MVLAAGLGSRLKPYTLHTPKPLIPLLGVPCIEYSLLQLPPVGVQSVVVNVHAHADQMLEYLKEEKHHSGLTLRISDESSKLLGSAGGFRKAISILESVPGRSEPFFALNADVVSSVDLNQLAVRHQEFRKKHGVVMTLCLARGRTLSTQEGSYTEILVNEATGLVSGLGEKKNKVPFYTGTAVFETEAFRHLTDGVPAEFVPEVLAPWIQKQKVGFFWMEDLWLDIGSPELWWKSHFILMNEMKKGSIPLFWKKAIEAGMKKGFFSEEKGIVDYDVRSLQSVTDSKRYIRLKGDQNHV